MDKKSIKLILLCFGLLIIFSTNIIDQNIQLRKQKMMEANPNMDARMVNISIPTDTDIQNYVEDKQIFFYGIGLFMIFGSMFLVYPRS